MNSVRMGEVSTCPTMALLAVPACSLLVHQTACVIYLLRIDDWYRVPIPFMAF